MSKSWVKQETAIIENSNIDRLARWIRNHREAVITITASVVAAVLLGFYFVSRYSKLKDTAWEKLFMAEQYAYSGKFDESFKRLDELTASYPNSSADAYGQMFRGDLLYKENKFKQAADVYSKLADNNQIKLLAPFALSNLMIAQAANNDCPTAAATGKKFLDMHSEHFLAPQVYYYLARCQSSLGQKDESLKTYEKISLMFPQTYWAEMSKAQISPAPPAEKK